MNTQHDPAMTRARKQARRLREFYGHFAVYVSVCTLLVFIDLVTGSSGETFLGLDWAFWPILGWGLAVAIHGFAASFAAGRGATWEDRKAAELYERERSREMSGR